ncbi:hypothetical protein LCGC14_3013240, partial [marine sediment metagenome]
REGYPEVATALESIAIDEAWHAAHFAELNGKISTSTKENLEKMLAGECAANKGKREAAIKAKEEGCDPVCSIRGLIRKSTQIAAERWGTVSQCITVCLRYAPAAAQTARINLVCGAQALFICRGVDVGQCDPLQRQVRVLAIWNGSTIVAVRGRSQNDVAQIILIGLSCIAKR